MVAQEQRVRPNTDGGGVYYQNPPLRERLVVQLLLDLGLTSPNKSWDLYDPDTFAENLDAHLRRFHGHASSGELHAVRFVASVWGNKKLIEHVGAFDLVDAFASLDEDNRAVIVAWCQEPWFA